MLEQIALLVGFDALGDGPDVDVVRQRCQRRPVRRGLERGPDSVVGRSLPLLRRLLNEVGSSLLDVLRKVNAHPLPAVRESARCGFCVDRTIARSWTE
jgi:hypothetical protein